MVPTASPLNVPNAAEATAQLELVNDEIKRLREHLAQRSRDEKKRMSQLEALRPKLKLLSKRAAPRLLTKGEKAVSVTSDEAALLESLKPAAKA